MAVSEDSHGRSDRIMAPHKWGSAPILEAVCQVNEHLVSALSELARLKSPTTVVVARNADVLRCLDATACSRAARIPLLLLDLQFRKEDWWRNAASASGKYRARTSCASGLPENYAAELTRESLIVTWFAVRHAPQSASLLFGMSNAVAGLLGDLTPQQLSRVAERSSSELCIRWPDKVDFWRRLFVAAQRADVGELSEIHLLGLQLLGGELIAAPSGG